MYSCMVTTLVSYRARSCLRACLLAYLATMYCLVSLARASYRCCQRYTAGCSTARLVQLRTPDVVRSTHYERADMDYADATHQLPTTAYYLLTTDCISNNDNAYIDTLNCDIYNNYWRIQG